MKIISFSQQGSRAICILAANGTISNVTLRQSNSSGGTLTYEVTTLYSVLDIYIYIYIHSPFLFLSKIKRVFLYEKLWISHLIELLEVYKLCSLKMGLLKCLWIILICFLQGRFEILSLTGSFMPSDNGVTKSRSGGMSVSLAGPDGRVLGGGLAGMLVAAGPVQVSEPFKMSIESSTFIYVFQKNSLCFFFFFLKHLKFNRS